jgi:hypothetical protein
VSKTVDRRPKPEPINIVDLDAKKLTIGRNRNLAKRTADYADFTDQKFPLNLKPVLLNVVATATGP